MDSDPLGNDLVRIDNGYTLVEEETYVVNSDDILGKSTDFHIFYTKDDPNESQNMTENT